MDSAWTKVLLVLLPVVVGAGIGIVPTMVLERVRAKATLRTRWDETLHTVCAMFAATTRRILDIAEEPEDHAAELDQEHRKLQVLMAEIRLLGGPAVQLAARNVVRHAWAVQMQATTGQDPRQADMLAQGPRDRTLTALFEFYLVVRRQLQVPDAEDLAPINPPVQGTTDAAAVP